MKFLEKAELWNQEADEWLAGPWVSEDLLRVGTRERLGVKGVF